MSHVPTSIPGSRYPHRVKVVARTSLVYVAGIVLGILVGLWTASMQLACPAFCIVGPPRFATVECVVMGILTAIAVPVVALAVDRDFIHATAQSYRTVTRFLFEDLSRQREG